MSDPIAAAEAAGKARDIANRFETAVFLIAYGIAEKDGLYEADPHRYPYSQAFRHGMNILAALLAECSDDAEELLPTFNESDFIRNSAASDVREWTARWRDECREAVEGCRSIEIGPLASVDGDYFAATSECYEVLRFAENDLLGGHQERRVYEFLRAGTQEQYVYGRRMLIRHPLLTWNEYVRIKTGLALGDPDPLDQGEADTIDPVWLQEFVSMAYEPVPGAAKVCPNCGWTMTMRGKQPHCSSTTCAKAVTGDFDKLDSVAHDAFRLSRGVMHYISSPGKLELAIAEAAAGLGLKYEMWPLKDTCDILIHLPDGRQLAVDAKAYGRPLGQHPFGSQRVGELKRAHQPVLIALERPAVAAREIVHTRLDLDEREGAGLELGGGRMVRRSVARTMRPVGHEIDPAGVIDPDLARDQGVLAAQPRPYLLGKLGGHLAAVSFPLHGTHSPSM